MKIGGLLGFLSAFALAYAILHRTHEYECICVALCFWGSYYGVINPSMEAIFADSVATGSRSKLYTYKQMAYVTAFGIGPLISLVLFWQLGNTWTLPEMRIVMLCGLGVTFVPSCVTFFFDDSKSLGEESESVSERPSQTERRMNLDEETSRGDGDTRSSSINSFAESDAFSDDIGDDSSSSSSNDGCIKQHHVAGIIIISNTIVAFASGMTIKFFPVFFADKVGLSPVSVSALTAATTFTLATFSFVAQRISLRIGRVQTAVACRTIGVSLLVAMAWLKPYWNRPFLIAPIYLFRTALMNCQGGLMQSVLMDHTKKSQRAKWSSLQTITQFGWSGSAMLGGVLCDRYGYETTFVITAGLQFLGTMVTTLLFGTVLVEDNAKKCSRRSAEQQDNKFDGSRGVGTRRPLLDPTDGEATEGDAG
jgi:MFS family permease